MVGAPLLIAFIAAAANAGAPERLLGIIAVIGISVHIVGLRFYRRKLRRSLSRAALHAPGGDRQLQTTIDDLRQWHLSQAYLLGALKLRASDDATRQLAAEAEDAAQGALALVNEMAASAKRAKSGKLTDERHVA